MVKKLAAMFLLSLLIVAFVATTVAFGADKPLKRFHERASIPARFAPVYSFPGVTGSEYTPPAPPPQYMDLRGGRQENPETIGSTTYGYQHNCTMGRQVEHDERYWPNTDSRDVYGWYIHFDWMEQSGDTLGQGRGVGYQAYRIPTCTHVFTPGGIRIEGSYAGYVCMDADTGWACPAAHEDDDGTWHAKAYWDFQAGGPAFGVFTTDFNAVDFHGHYQNDGIGPGNENIWPKTAWDIDGAEDVLHMVTTETGGEAGDPQTHSYYRRTGPYGTGLGVWSNQRLIDTVMNINVTVASSPISDRVAIVWNAPADYKRDTPDEFSNQLENDVWYCMATDNGAEWSSVSPGPSIGHMIDMGAGGNYSGGNVTTYAVESDHKAYCDMSALFAVGTNYAAPPYDDELQIVWGCRRWTDTTSLYRRQSSIFHWRESDPTNATRSVIKAWWDTGGACVAHAWGSDVAKMTISECDNRLYVCFTQFGSSTNPCGDVDADNQVVNGYLYMSVYDPVLADAWDRAQRVTTTSETPTGCIPGDMSGPGTCNSEYWSSMARYGRYDTCKLEPPDNALDVIYINDYAPGGCVQTESGVWTVNDVNWVVYPCREAVPEPGYADDAGPGYGLCVGEPIEVMGTTDSKTIILTMENPGLLPNPYTIATSGPTINGTPTANTTVGVAPGAGTIALGGGTATATITITTTGEQENVTVIDTITVNHAAPDNNPRKIPLCITVTDYYIDLESAVIATTIKRLRVYNNGQMSNNGSNMSMDFIDDPDDCADIYLYDGSPIICIDRDHCYFSCFDNDYASDHALRQVTPIYVDSVSNDDYTYATAEFVTGDTSVGMIVEYYAPKAEENRSFIVEKLKFWNRGEVELTHVKVGQVLDWDIPSFDHASNNESGTDQSRNLIYQYCCDSDPCDSADTCERFGGVASYGTAFKNYMTLENDVYIYTSGPYGNDAPLPDSAMYDLMDDNDGFHTAELDSCEDLFTLVTFGVYDLAPGDTICVIKILTTSKQDPGAAWLKTCVDNANDFIDAHDEIQCPSDGVCDCIPGDANEDADVNVGDAVYIINYVFKNGPAPAPYPKCSGDANTDCDCNVGDAVYIINYVFKNGPPPPDCPTWEAACGPGLYK